MGTTLFFGAAGMLWKSNGTTAGTVAVKDIPLPPSFIPGAMVALGDTALLAAGGPSFTDDQLWRSDGTTVGTVMVKQIAGGGDVSQLTVLGSSVVFRAYDPAHGYELWRSDGTEAARPS